jgi:predicted DNA-binding ribbon-helix-helix protein
MAKLEEHSPLEVERVQIGVRMEKRMLKVLKALAEYHDISLADLLEGIVLHAFENILPFSEETLRRVAQLKDVYGMNYGANASHQFKEQAQEHADQKQLS